MIVFSDEEKVQMFDMIANRFYNRNFGTCTKSEFDLLMFHFYLKKLETEKKPIINKCSDYSISKELGITQQRVRSYKIKENLIYPRSDYNWIDEFAVLVKNARIDNNKIVINIMNPNLYIEIENYLEESGSYIEKQLNSKLMIIRIEYFIDLCLLFEDEKNRKQVIKDIKKQCKNADIDIKKFDDDKIGKSLIETTANVTSIFANISTCFSPGNIIADSLIYLLDKKLS